MDLRGAVDSLPEPTALPQPADQGDLLKPDDTAHPEGRHAGVFRGPAQHGALVDLKHARNVLGREAECAGTVRRPHGRAVSLSGEGMPSPVMQSSTARTVAGNGWTSCKPSNAPPAWSTRSRCRDAKYTS